MDSASPPERLYAGQFRHSIDEKNRVTVPSRWRRDKAEELILLPEANHQFLLVMSPTEFARMSSAAESNENVSARDRRIFLLVGSRGRFEIWNLQRWKRAHEEETPTYQHVASVIGL